MRLEHFTVDWINGVLEEWGDPVETKVVDIRATKLGPMSIGLLHGIVRIELTYENEDIGDLPKTMIVKVPDPDAKLIGDSAHDYGREALFYKHIAPIVGTRLPKCYGASRDPDSLEFVVLLEDMADYAPADRMEGLTLEQAKEALKVIARVHASLWEHEDVHKLFWMPERNYTPDAFMHIGGGERWEHFRDFFGTDLPKDFLEIGKKVNDNFERLWEIVDTRPKTVTHYAYGADNLLMAEQNGSLSIVPLDWDLTVRSMGALDVAKLVGGSINAELREGRADKLVNTWWMELVREGVHHYSFDDAWRDFRLGTLFNLQIPVIKLESYVGNEERVYNLIRLMMERFYPLAVEINAGSML